MNKSIWELPIEHYPKLEEDIECDVCIVGGGITGISLAYYLKNTNGKVVLIEQGDIGASTTMRTTAKLTYLQQDMLSKIKKCHGEAVAKMYYLSQRYAINEVTKIIENENIACDLEKNESYLFVQEQKNIEKLKKEFHLYKKFGAPVEWKKYLPIDNNEKLCCAVPDTFVFHPLKYLRGLLESIKQSKNIFIYEKTRMIQCKKKKNGYLLDLENRKTIKAKTLVFAGHYPPFLFPYFFPIKAYIKKDLVTAQMEKEHFFNAINLDNNILSMRFHKNHMIKVIDSKKLSKAAILQKKNNKENKNNFLWSNYDIETLDSLPIVGYIGSPNNGLYIATGYNGWGMTNSNLAAQILASEIKGEKNLLHDLFTPYRNLSFPILLNGLVNLFDNAYNFISFYFPNKKSKFQIVWKDGQRRGIVFDENGKKHEILLTCPHMKCGLLYNEKEKTWDCPCHGSRFDIDGNLIKGPAVDCVKPNKGKSHLK